jgi:hypothetical protein
MKMIGIRCVLLLAVTQSALGQDIPDLNVILMQSTFMLKGTTASGGSTMGTGFLLFRTFAAQASETSRKTGKLILVTAAHVLEDMSADDAIIFLRSRQNGTENWSVVPAHFKIRSNGQPLWKKNPGVDVAVMYVKWPLPPQEPLPDTGLLVDDEQLKKFGVGTGVELKDLGFPLGNAGNDAGFPILRTGVIASYPLLPTANTKTFLFDFRVFKGNSGGPVYFSEPVVKGSAYMCCPPQFIMGLVSEERILPVSSADLYETRVTQYPLSLGVVVHASLIKATIELLPAPETPESNSMTVPVELVTNQQAH